jgi:hypothetical protein
VTGPSNARAEPGGTETAARRPTRPGRGQHQQLADMRTWESPQRPAWPSAPARREPDRIAPAAQRSDTKQSPAQHPGTGAVPREKRTTAPVTAEDPDPDAEGGRPGQRPSPDPGGPARAETQTRQAVRAAGTAPPAAASRTSHRSAVPGASPSADWRDDIIRVARQPWQQPGPSWPDNPAVHRPPEPWAQEPGIEPNP